MLPEEAVDDLNRFVSYIGETSTAPTNSAATSYARRVYPVQNTVAKLVRIAQLRLTP